MRSLFEGGTQKEGEVSEGEEILFPLFFCLIIFDDDV